MPYLDRKSLLKQYISEEPKNPFNWYALALELQQNEPEEAKLIFEKLLQEFPDYLPTYYQAAFLFDSLGLLDQAKKTFEEGINLATRQQDQKAIKELKNAYQNFLFENDLDEEI
ncbi:tetratricopeptide repeat protein [Algoriphagus sp. NBT04N3]|uniref:tetratricopeptide repeat protein n=1 Tax=Algoriphagus sp. NBT04N3 TaxID=2705473 RepID=UPI001C633259|nr:tetratricopeptide repeat protein [Algoriphagus sp. NBT04N3]QYH38654.1 tetratricopeptide repeat protein [Algoriphagus sp. NBT04N3]